MDDAQFGAFLDGAFLFVIAVRVGAGVYPCLAHSLGVNSFQSFGKIDRDLNLSLKVFCIQNTLSADDLASQRGTHGYLSPWLLETPNTRAGRGGGKRELLVIQCGAFQDAALLELIFYMLLPLSSGVYGANPGPDYRDVALAARAFGPNLERVTRLKLQLDHKLSATF
ncbi:hypothetical protein GGR57DRAFT_500691 [Xylariaceae sp. FL1272]|nr:hypothetical protein GGR57DRAFT_500691 [Xylariaceae sp. FL1272]